MRIILLRHAQTHGNLLSNYTGSTDEPLSPRGIATARAATRRDDVRIVHTSALQRTRETAKIMYPNATVIQHPGLNEMHFGDFEGKNFRDLEYDPAYAAWLDTNCEAPCPNGENKDDFIRRCGETFYDILREQRAKGGDEIRFVVHDGTIMAIMSRLVAIPRRAYFEWHVDFCGGYGIVEKRVRTTTDICVPFARLFVLRETLSPPHAGERA